MATIFLKHFRQFLIAWILFSFLTPQALIAESSAFSHVWTEEETHKPFSESSFLGQDFLYRSLYLSMGACLGLAAGLSITGWWASIICPWTALPKKECLFFSQLCSSAALSLFKAAIFQSFAKIYVPGKGFAPISQKSWEFYRWQLNAVPVISEKESRLLTFLEKRWLAKGNGFYRAEVDWVCPCFQIPMQVHPETTNCYARDPFTSASIAYNNQVERWKQILPHPKIFPLILTRPYSLQKYLPNYHALFSQDSLALVLEKCRETASKSEGKTILDIGSVFPLNKSWEDSWNAFSKNVAALCREKNIDLNRLIFVQSFQEKDQGVLRLLPIENESSSQVQKDFEKLLEWISHAGLTATLVELDRDILSDIQTKDVQIDTKSRWIHKELCLSSLSQFRNAYLSPNLQKKIMVLGFLDALQGLLNEIEEDKWQEIMRCPTRSSLVCLSMENIQEQFSEVLKEKASDPFFQTVCKVELMHANFTALLEIFSPFETLDFPKIYQDIVFPSFPDPALKIEAGVHASGMTSLSGVLKAVNASLGKSPHVIYGENTYFECVHVLREGGGKSSLEAEEEDWKLLDLLICQFNPVLKRDIGDICQYKEEKVAENIRKALSLRKDKPFVVAIDSSLDYLHSHRFNALFQEFEKEIKEGIVNFICIRSGVKFDLFGIDNYSGAPFFTIHSSHPHWQIMDAVLKDPVLSTDPLSFNWFCLAYKYLPSHLEAYRKQIFENTRNLLNKVPSSLFQSESSYRLIPMDGQVDPSFIDIKVKGRFHRMKIAALVGGILYLRCMQEGHPVFFRRSLGLYHPNFGILFGNESSTIRFTLGLDPGQVDVLASCFEKIHSLN